MKKRFILLALAAAGTLSVLAPLVGCSDDEATPTPATNDAAVANEGGSADAGDGALPTGPITGKATYNGTTKIEAEQPALNVAVIKKYPPGPEGVEIMGLSFVPTPVFPGTVDFGDPRVDIGEGVIVVWWGELVRPGFEFPRPTDPIGFQPITVKETGNAPITITLEDPPSEEDAGTDAGDAGDAGT